MEALAPIGDPPRRRARLDKGLPVWLEGSLEEVEGLGLALRPVGARGLQPLRRVHVEHALAEEKALLRDTLTRHGLPR